MTNQTIPVGLIYSLRDSQLVYEIVYMQGDRISLKSHTHILINVLIVVMQSFVLKFKNTWQGISCLTDKNTHHYTTKANCKNVVCYVTLWSANQTVIRVVNTIHSVI